MPVASTRIPIEIGTVPAFGWTNARLIVLLVDLRRRRKSEIAKIVIEQTFVARTYDGTLFESTRRNAVICSDALHNSAIAHANTSIAPSLVMIVIPGQ